MSKDTDSPLISIFLALISDWCEPFVSAESGIRTFRDAGGLWEGYRIDDVATPEAWRKDPVLVTRFYNERRRNVLDAQPNAGHLGLVELE